MDYITSILLVTLFMYVISSFCKSCWTLPHLDSSSSLPPVSVCPVSVSVSVWAGGEGRGVGGVWQWTAAQSAPRGKSTEGQGA